MDVVDQLRIAAGFPMDPRFRQTILQAADEIERLRAIADLWEPKSYIGSNSAETPPDRITTGGDLKR